MSSNEASEVSAATSAAPGVSKTAVETSETTVTTLKADENGTASTVIHTTIAAIPVKITDAGSPVEVTVTSITPKATVAEAVSSTGTVAPSLGKTASVTGAEKPAATAAAKTASAPAKAATNKTGPVKAVPAKPATGKAGSAKTTGTASTAKTAPASSTPKTSAVNAQAKTAQAGTKAKAVPKTAPPGYKLIKVKNAEGKVIVVKKKLTPEELAAAEKKGDDVTPDNTASDQTKSVAYKIVSVPQPNGTLVKVRRAVHPEDVTRKPEADTASKDAEADNPKEEPVDEATRQAMIRDQKHTFRMGRTRKYRRSLLRGFAMQLIGELPDIELDSHGFQDGDQVISDDDSDLEFDSDNDDDVFSNHDGDGEKRTVGDNDDSGGDGGDDLGIHENVQANSGSKMEINTEAVAKNVYNAAESAQPKKKPAAAAARNSGTAAKDVPPADGKTAPAAASPANGTKDKITYKITEKDLEKLDEDKPSSQLRHHWGTFSFYFMASLSIILPLLFVLLSIGTSIMNGKTVGSRWDAVSNALKFAVSAWPIVFAAVVAQCFKTYATYKVERGIKLLQLEQLVGSNSFASALKQPIMLRRLDIYTLVIFVAWCLSPIGSQAIVRVQSAKWTQTCTNTSVWYLNRNGLNPVFDNVTDYYNDGNDIGTHLQQATMAFGTTFDPYSGIGGKKKDYFQDSWGNPQTFMHSGNLSSVFGVPFFFTDSLFYAEFDATYYDNDDLTAAGYDGADADTTRQESFTFPIQSSYFNFDCGNWTTLSSNDMADKVDKYELETVITSYPTYYMSFGLTDDELNSADDTTTVNLLRWGSFNWLDAPSNSSISDLLDYNITGSGTLEPMRNSSATYSYIECPIEQLFVVYNITCGILQEDFLNGGSYQCTIDSAGMETLNTTQNGTQFYDFTIDFLSAVSPTQYTGGTTITPFERYLASGGLKFDNLFTFTDNMETPGKINSSYAFWYDMSNNTTPAEFGGTFAFAFNSWMDSGYCPGACRTAYPTLLLKLADDADIPLDTEETMSNSSKLLGDDLLIPQSMFSQANSTWCYTQNYVYVIHPQYLALLYICSVVLLLLGVISVVVESRIVAPDVLGYASTVARNSRYLHLPATAPGLSGADRVRKFGGTVVMMQDVKKGAPVGKIALGNKKDDSERLRVDRTYR